LTAFKVLNDVTEDRELDTASAALKENEPFVFSLVTIELRMSDIQQNASLLVTVFKSIFKPKLKIKNLLNSSNTENG
jgi:hypothetical protein